MRALGVSEIVSNTNILQSHLVQTRNWFRTKRQDRINSGSVVFSERIVDHCAWFYWSYVSKRWHDRHPPPEQTEFPIKQEYLSWIRMSFLQKSLFYRNCQMEKNSIETTTEQENRLKTGCFFRKNRVFFRKNSSLVQRKHNKAGCLDNHPKSKQVSKLRTLENINRDSLVYVRIP